MADKKEKIAAAKKRLKEFQTKQHKQDKGSSEDLVSIPDDQQSQQRNDIAPTTTDIIAANYFTGDVTNNNSNPLASFFNPSLPEAPFVPPSEASPAGSITNLPPPAGRPFSPPSDMPPTTIPIATDQYVPPVAQPLRQSPSGLFAQMTSQISAFMSAEPASAPTFTPPPQDTYQVPDDQYTQLNDELNNQRRRNEELSVHVLNQNSHIEDLRNTIDRLKLENSTRVTMEMGPLQEQLQSHVQTIGVLVGEKADLSASLNKFQGLAKQKITEVEELQGRLNASRHRVQVLEKEITTVKSSHDKYDTSQQRLCQELEVCQEDLRTARKRLDDSQDEIAELKQKLSLKNKDIEALESDMATMRSELSVCRLRIEQFSSGDSIEADSKIESLTQQKHYFEQTTQELQKMVQQLGLERDQASQQYQTYVQQLNKETVNLAQQLQEYVVDNERLSKREESLVKHVGDLERQIQQQIAKQKLVKEGQSSAGGNGGGVDKVVHDETVAALSVKCDQLDAVRNQMEHQLHQKTHEMTSLQVQLQQQQATISQLENQMEQLQSVTVDPRGLIASMESDKVAAARAVTQNVDLKQQLEEMQKAFVQISNDKLELTERLQSEQHLGRENKIKANTLDTEVASIKDKLHYKDEEMIRLSHENEELNKQILQFTQETDRLRHYEAKSQTSNALHHQLQSSNEINKRLRSKIKELESGGGAAAAEGAPAGGAPDGISIEGGEEATEITNTEDITTTVPDEIDGTDTVSVTSTVHIASEEAMEKLQQRFTRTMSEIADLTEEKNRLEHLVMQLQGETETIGEYVALYQNQRRLLKQREIEKDVQLQQIVSDREEMKEKLLQLNRLVEQLLAQKGVPETQNIAVDNHRHNHGHCSHDHDHDIQHHNDDQLVNGNGVEPHNENEPLLKSTNSVETASKILNLLSEIQDRNQNQRFAASMADVHNCAYCYGKLETV